MESCDKKPFINLAFFWELDGGCNKPTNTLFVHHRDPENPQKTAALICRSLR